MSVREITTGELVKIRGGRQFSKVFVIPRVPNAVYSARLAAVPATHDMVAQVTITDGIGDIADVRPDMKVLVGSSASGDDIGFCRVRGLPDVDVYGDGTLYIGELSHIDWQAECHITIVDDYDIFPRPVRIVGGQTLLDYNIEYTDQHADFDPIVNMGGHRVILLDPDTGIAAHVRNCTDEESAVFGGTIASYLWEAPGASSIEDETTDEATFNYDAEGDYVEYCTLTTDDGKEFTGARYTFVRDADLLDAGAMVHSLKITEGRKEGISMNFEMASSATLDDFKHRAFVIAFSIDYYGGVKETISYRQYEGNVLGFGRISNEQVVFNDEMGIVKFTARDWKYWLKRVSVFPFGLERATNTPAVWTSMPGLNVDRAAWALLHYYCTLSRIADIHLSGDTRYAEELASTSNNLLSQLEEVVFTTIFADLIFDCFGIGWLRVEPQLVPEADRELWPVVQVIIAADYVGQLSAELNIHDEMSQMNSSGVSVEQFGSAAARISLSYGHMYSPFGDPSTASNLLLESQEQSNVMAGLFMGWNNRRFDSMPFEFTGSNRMFSLAEYCRAEIEIMSGINPRGISYNGYLCPRAIAKNWDTKSGFLEVTVDFQDESREQLAVTGDFPAETGIVDGDFSQFPMPSIPLPSLPVIYLPPAEENLNRPKKIVIASSKGVLYTENADAEAADIVWTYMNEGLSELELADIGNLLVTPSGTLYLLTQNTTVYTADGLGGSWSQLWNLNDYPNQPAYIAGIGVNPLAQDQIAIFGGRKWTISPLDYGMSYLCVGSKSGMGSLNNIVNFHAFPAAVLYLYGGWLIYHAGLSGILGGTPYPRIARCGASGAYAAIADNINGWGPASQFAIPIGTSEKSLYWHNNAIHDQYTDIVGIDTQTVNYGIAPKANQSIAFSPTGTHGMAESGGLHTPYKTTDGGATWESAAGTVPAGADVWENCRDNNRWIFGGGTSLKYTLDQGATLANIEGNLTYIASLLDITHIRFIA